MDQRPEPERIEIELTSHGPTAGPTAVRVAEPDSAEPDGDRPGWLDTERGRLLASTAFVGVVALLMGVVVGGRTGADDPITIDDPAGTASETTVTREPESTATSPENVETLPAVVAPSAPASTPSSTTPPPTFESRDVLPTTPGVGASISIADEVADLPVELIAIQPDGDIVIVDLATGAAMTRDLPTAAFGGPTTLHSGDGWILVADADQGATSLLLDDGTVQPVAVSGGPVFPVPGTDLMWGLDFSGPTGWSIAEYSVDGTPTGRQIDGIGDAPFGGPGVWPQTVDPRGGVIVSAPGGAYTIDVDAADRITSGSLVAVGTERALAYECDARLVCSFVVIDRSSGDRQAIELDAALGPSASIESGIWGASSDLFDATEERLLVSSWNAGGGASSGVLDLTTGAYTEISGDYVQQMKWGPDGRFVFWLSPRGDMRVFDPERGASVPLSDDLTGLQGFTLRRALPDSDG